MAKFYGYKDYIGCNGFDAFPKEGEKVESNHLSKALINNPFEEGQLGFVLKLDECEFNQEAIDILRKVQKSNDDIGDIDVFSSNEGNAISWLGGPLAIMSSESEGSNSYDYSLLDTIKPIDLEIPEDFKKIIDENYI